MSNATMSNETTVIGAGTVLQGDLRGEEDLQVLGRIEGSIATAGAVLVDLDAVVAAGITAEQVTVRGAVMGDIRCAGLVHLGAEARVAGGITAPRVRLDEGAQFRGVIAMGSGEAPPAPVPKEKAPARRTLKKIPRTRKPAMPVAPVAPVAKKATPKKKAAPAKKAPARRTRTKAPAKKKKKKAPPKPPTAAGKKVRTRRK